MTNSTPLPRMRNITITWRAFADINPASLQGRNPAAYASVQVPSDADPRQLCEELFEATNLYQGPLWDALEPLLPADRTHTALSVGDWVTVDGEIFSVEPVGFARVAG